MPRPTMRTEITHTVNVVQKERGFFGGAAHQCVVTKYIIHVSLPSAGSAVPLEWQVARRYSHFRSNHAALSSMFNNLPKLPPKGMWDSKGLSSSSAGLAPPDPELIASRMVLLDPYLKQLLAIPAISGCTQMRTFLGAYQGMQPAWFEGLSRDSLARMTPLPDDLVESSASPASPATTPGAWGSAAADGASPALAHAHKGDGSGHASASALDPPPLEEFAPGAAGDNSAAQAIIREMGLLVSADAFAAQFPKLHFASQPDVAAGMVQRFLNGMEAAVAVAHPEVYPNGCTEGALWWARDVLEDRLLHRLHDHVFGVLAGEQQQDTELSDCLDALSDALTPAQLDVSAAFCDTRFNRWAAASAELRQIALRRTPRAKMDCTRVDPPPAAAPACPLLFISSPALRAAARHTVELPNMDDTVELDCV
jgi:hypothetical protein